MKINFILLSFIAIFFFLTISSCSLSNNFTKNDTKNLNTDKNENILDNSDYNEIVNSSINQLENLRFELAEETLIEGLIEYKDDKDLLGLLGISLFKQDKFDLTVKVLGRYFELNDDSYDLLNSRVLYNDKSNNNDLFDIFYYYISSLIELRKVDNAGYIISNKISKESKLKLQIDKQVKLEILEIKINFLNEKYDIVVEKINKLFKNFNIISESLKLNLYYLEAISYYKILDYPTSLEVILKIIQIDKENLYSIKLFKSLEEIIYLADSDFLEMYGENIVKCYEEILDGTKEKSVRNKILRNIYDLYNSISSLENSVNLISEEGVSRLNKISDMKNSTVNSIISQISIKTDRNSTKIQFSSNDSLSYSYLYDGKSLQIDFDETLINSKNRSITPKEGSGINSFNWKINKNNKKLSFILTFNDNYDMDFEELHDNFEKNEKYSDKHHLVLNIALPDDESFSLVDKSFKRRLNEKKKYTIILDPGHGGDDPGALAVKKKKNGKKYTEKEVALILSKELKKYLEKKGYRVFLTRTKDTYPTLPERNRIAESRNADMFLSIHLNSANKKNRKYWQTERYFGSELIVRKTLGSQPKFVNSTSGNKQDSKNKWLKKRKKALKEHLKLSNIFNETISSNLHKPFSKKRRIKQKNLAIFSGLTIPHALIEAGFIINNRSLEYLLSTKGQNALFKGIFKGIKEYRKK